jgi:hypothetical protein
MSDIREHNLDYLAAKHAQKFIENANGKGGDIENKVTKALGVLQENGVYACFLYLQANKKKDDRKDDSLALTQEMRALLEALGIKNDNGQDALTFAQIISGDLHTLLLAKEALEQMLIYARYGAKAET